MRVDIKTPDYDYHRLPQFWYAGLLCRTLASETFKGRYIYYIVITTLTTEAQLSCSHTILIVGSSIKRLHADTMHGKNCDPVIDVSLVP